MKIFRLLTLVTGLLLFWQLIVYLADFPYYILPGPIAVGKAFLAQFLINHPEESWQLFIKGRKNLDDELNRRAWADTMPRFALRPGALDRSRYETFARFMKEQGMLKKIPSLDTVAVELR